MNSIYTIIFVIIKPNEYYLYFKMTFLTELLLIAIKVVMIGAVTSDNDWDKEAWAIIILAFTLIGIHTIMLIMSWYDIIKVWCGK